MPGCRGVRTAGAGGRRQAATPSGEEAAEEGNRSRLDTITTVTERWDEGVLSIMASSVQRGTQAIMKKWISAAVILGLAIASRGVILGAFLLPIAADIFIATHRDRRYKWTPWPLTRRVCRWLFVSPPKPTPVPPAFTYAPGAPLGETRQRAPLSREIRQAVWTRDGGRCRSCGISDEESMSRTGEHLQYDHVIPFSRNGADTVANIQLLCGPCNRIKSNRY